MPALSEYTNVYGTALAILEDKGFQFWYVEAQQLYWAEKDGWEFASESPCGLLGLVAIFEARHPDAYGEYWWRDRSREVDIVTGVPRQPRRPYTSILAAQRGPRST